MLERKGRCGRQVLSVGGGEPVWEQSLHRFSLSAMTGQLRRGRNWLGRKSWWMSLRRRRGPWPLAAILAGCARGDAAAAQALRGWENGRVAQQLTRTFGDAGQAQAAVDRLLVDLSSDLGTFAGGDEAAAQDWLYARMRLTARRAHSDPRPAPKLYAVETSRASDRELSAGRAPSYRAGGSARRRRAGSHERATAAPHGRGSWPRHPCRGEGKLSSTPLWPARHNVAPAPGPADRQCSRCAGGALALVRSPGLGDRPANSHRDCPATSRSDAPSSHRARAHAARATRAADRHAGAAGGRSTDEASFSSASTRRDGTDPAATYRGAPQWEPGERVRSRSARFAAPLGGLRAGGSQGGAIRHRHRQRTLLLRPGPIAGRASDGRDRPLPELAWACQTEHAHRLH